ncbi:MAG: TIR domain-containing protein [Pseudomonadota bacterium]
MADDEPKPLVFISYSHKDEVYKDQVLTHLGGLSLMSQLEPWHDGDIGAGENWYEEIEEKLNGCAVAVLLISANFLNSKFCMQTEVPILLERRRRQKMMIMPILVESCFWQATPWLNAIQMRPGKGNVIEALTKPKRNAAYTKIIEEIHGFLESNDARDAITLTTAQTTTVRGGNNQIIQVQGSYNTIVLGSEPKADTTYPKPLAVDLTRLPTSGMDVVGRDKELQFLNEAFDGDALNVISLRAWGGVGKSTLVNKWCEYLAADSFRGATRVFAWSFYSQGTNERVTSADAFIDEALRFFGDDEPEAGSPWSKGERLAELVGEEKALLILDGMEPLQDEHQGIKDPALARLVECLAETNAGLCVITTREPVKELSDFPETTREVDLEQLSKEAGRALLRIKGLRATDYLLEQASEAFGNHALALNLLASYLKRFAGGDVKRALTIPDLPDVTVEDGKHPRRVMGAFAEKFDEGSELDLLHIMGLFDRPADGGCIAVLRKPPAIHGLTGQLSALDEIAWRNLLEELRGIGLLAETSHHAPDELDAHPLVREHFGERLSKERASAWKAGHNRLYKHLRCVPEQEQPDTLADLAPLFQAVHHGCQAGRWQEVLNEIYRERINRGTELYSTTTLGAFGIDLGLVASFFAKPFVQSEVEITDRDRAWLLNHTIFHLRALGRLVDAVAPIEAALDVAVEQGRWLEATKCGSRLSTLLLDLGQIDAAVAMGQSAVKYADRSNDEYQQLVSYTILADAHHQSGEIDQAKSLFEDAEQIEPKHQPDYPRLYSVYSYRYFELLITLGKIDVVHRRAEQTLECMKKEDGWLLGVALNYIYIGHAALALGDGSKALTNYNLAVDSLRESGTVHQIPRGLLARAACLRYRDNLLGSRHDLDEVVRIATRCGLRLRKCDAHLEYARLALAEGNPDEALPHLKSADALVTDCGYHRRDPEIADLKEKLGQSPPSQASQRRPASGLEEAGGEHA